MNNNRRRNFRPRNQKHNYRRRNGSINSNNGSGFNNSGNISYGRNGSMTNPHSVEKAMQKFQQLAKDAQSNGDPVLVENYLQHADHYSRRLAELNEKNKESPKKDKTQNLETTSSDTNTKVSN